MGSSEVKKIEGVFEGAEVVISVDGPTFAEAGVKYLKSTSEERGGLLQPIYKNDDLYNPSRNRLLTVVEGFGCLHDPRSYVVGGCLPLIGSPTAIFC